MRAGTLVRVFHPITGYLDTFGPAMFVRELIPTNDLPRDHTFWRNRTSPDVLANSLHNEIFYGGTLHIIVADQFILVPADSNVV